MSEENNNVAATDAQVAPPPESVSPEVELTEQVVDAQADSSPAPAEDSPLDDNQPDPSNKGKNRAKERIEDLVAEKNAAKEYAEYWRLKALEVINQETKKPTAVEKPVQEQVEELPAPTLDQFNYDNTKWSKAMTEWAKAQARVSARQELEAARQQDVQQSVIRDFETKIEKFKESHPDFDIVMQNPKLPVLDKVANAMIIASEHSAELTYALGKNPDLAIRISRMNPSQQALAIGRLESEIRVVPTTKQPPQAAAPKKTPPVVTQAPPPPEVIPSGGVAEPDPYTMSTQDWMKWRVSQVRQQRRQR